MRWPPCSSPWPSWPFSLRPPCHSWKQMAQREKEAELIFRGQQYARANRTVPAPRRTRREPAQPRCARSAKVPPQEVQRPDHRRRLRSDFSDHADVRPHLANSRRATRHRARDVAGHCRARADWTTPGCHHRGGLSQPLSSFGTRHAARRGTGRVRRHRARAASSVCRARAKLQSIRIYNGRTHYNEWQFVYIPQTAQPGRARPARSSSTLAFRSAAILSADRFAAAMDGLATRRYSTAGGRSGRSNLAHAFGPARPRTFQVGKTSARGRAAGSDNGSRIVKGASYFLDVGLSCRRRSTRLVSST